MNAPFLPAARLATPRRPWWSVLLATALAASVLPAGAARIAEPDSVIYGRIVHRFGERVLPVTSGTLVWSVRTRGGVTRELQFSAPVRPLAGGRFHYQLRLPVRVLTHDLEAGPGTVGVPATGTSVEFLSVQLDGREVQVQPLTSTGIAVSQQQRAAGLRVDLELIEQGPDSDGDGWPDSYELAHDADPWDPADAPSVDDTTGTGGGGGADPRALTARTFAEWRAALFPGDTRNLDLFALEDGDADGVANLFEYAFGLDPRAADPQGSGLPRFDRTSLGARLEFFRRAEATDLTYVIESSEDLRQWQAATPGQATEGGPLKFYRVRIERAGGQP